MCTLVKRRIALSLCSFLLVLVAGPVLLSQATVTITPSPFFQRYNFYYDGLLGYTAYGYQTEGDTFQCAWADDGYTYCEANDTKDNSSSDGGSGASLMIEKFDSNFITADPG